MKKGKRTHILMVLLANIQFHPQFVLRTSYMDSKAKYQAVYDINIV